ncbi:MAG: hypothetical protein LBU82_07745, partial [Treponema sp.]|nr:hypothetical protein [Treponema sp.]
MASEKRPSVYSDRGSFGSAEELDEYGVWIKCEPQDMSLTDSEDLEDAGLSMPVFEDSASDNGAFTGFDSSGLEEIEFPSNNLSMESDDNLPDVAALSAEESISGDFDDFPVTNAAADSEPPVSEDDFEVPTVEAIETSSRVKESDLSNQLLQKIANELSSIRNELSELKKEFAVVRASSPVNEEKKDDQHGGFFSEEEDETIALTGDELNNILNTADFTEESGTNETPEEPQVDTPFIDDSTEDEENADEKNGEDESIQVDLDSLGIDINSDVPTDGEIPAVEEPPMENLAVLEIPDEDDELEKLRIEGAVPMNPVPENISYLEESEIAEFADGASITSSSFDINDTAIEEPELEADSAKDDAAESLTDDIGGDEIDINSLDDLAIANDGVETEEPGLGETAAEKIENISDISIEAAVDDGHDIVLPMPEDSFDIDMLTDESLDISIPEDDFATPQTANESAETLPAPDESFDALMDDALDISSMPEDDFATPPESADLPAFEESLDALTDDALDISIPEDDFATPPAADESAETLPAPDEALDALTDDALDISIPEDDFATPQSADENAETLPAPDESFDALPDDALDISIPED